MVQLGILWLKLYCWMRVCLVVCLFGNNNKTRRARKLKFAYSAIFLLRQLWFLKRNLVILTSLDIYIKGITPTIFISSISNSVNIKSILGHTFVQNMELSRHHKTIYQFKYQTSVVNRDIIDYSLFSIYIVLRILET